MNTYERARSLFLRGYDTVTIANQLGITEAALYNSGFYTKAKEAAPPSAHQPVVRGPFIERAKPWDARR